MLTWTPSDSIGVVGYRIYFGIASRQYDQARGTGEYTSATSFTVAELIPGVTYYFAVTAIDSLNESDFSNEVFKTITP